MFALAAPVRIKIDDGDLAEREVFGDVDRRAVRDYFDLFSAVGDDRSRRRKLILLVFGWVLSDPISVFFLGQFPPQFRLLILQGDLTGSLFGRVAGGLRRIVMKTVLDLL